MDIAVVEGPDALAELKPEWDALLARCPHPHPFLTHEWLTASWRHYAEGDRLLTLCVRDEGRLVGVVGLRAKRSWGAERLLFAVNYADYCDLLIEAGAEWTVLEALLQWLAEDHRDWDLLRLRSVSASSETSRLLPVLAAQAGLASCATRADTTPYIVLPPTREDLHRSLPSRGRISRHLQMRRKLETDHGELIVRATPATGLTPDVFTRFLALHRRSWADRGGSAAMPDDRAARFQTDAATALAPAGLPLIVWVSLASGDVAAYYGFVVGRTFFAYITGYDPDFSAYSPGGQMMLSLIEYGIEQGWQTIDLMRGAERYKFDYTRRCSYVMDHTLARTPLKLRLFTASSALRALLDR